jgi:hypothetical protein
MEPHLRYPNRRYGNPTAMAHYAMWYGSTAELAKALRRSERSVNDWLSGRAKVPWWVPEIMRLQQLEHNHMAYQITGRQQLARLGIVQSGQVVDAGQRFSRPVDLAPPIENAGTGPALLTSSSACGTGR